MDEKKKRKILRDAEKHVPKKPKPNPSAKRKRGEDEEGVNPSKKPNNELNNDQKLETLVVNDFVPFVSPKQPLLSTVSVYGRRGSGKSVFLKWYTQHLKEEFPYIYVFTKTKLNGFYAGFVPERYIMDHISEEKLLELIDRQTKAMDLFHKSDGAINPRILVIMDDENENIRYSKVMEKFYYFGRHIGIFIIFCAQHWSMTPPCIRTQTDLAILFNSDYRNAVEEFWADFAGKAAKKGFFSMMEEHLGDHGFVAIDNQSGVTYDKKFFAGQAEDLPASIDYILGCEKAWRGSEKQLWEIESGKFQEKAERLSKLKEFGMFKDKEKSIPPTELDDDHKFF